jgi:hypothetical protein
MYVAELKGKIPSNLEKMEDLLTSNVFSFFKYSKREIFLKILLEKLQIKVSNHALDKAEFIFWPSYEDKTEPDLVIIVGDYYLLFESKYFSDFAKETPKTEKQLIREAVGGLKESKLLNKNFIYIAITADYNKKPEKFREIEDLGINIKWINWQSISEILLNLIEKEGNNLPDYLFALDLYNLLDKKKLRSFRSFNNLNFNIVEKKPENLFFSFETALFRGDFIGFEKSFLDFPAIVKPPKTIFFNRIFFGNISYKNKEFKDNIFYKSEVRQWIRI